jgi:phage terminase small subunit
MPILKNTHHELYAQGLAQGKTAQAAYEDAGYKPNGGNPYRLKDNERIQRRVAEIQSAAAERVMLSRVDLLNMMIDDHEQARQRGQMSAAIKAAELLGREIAGLYAERREITTREDLSHLSDEQLHDELVKAIEALGMPNVAARVRERKQA